MFRIVESPKQETTPNTFSCLLILAPRIKSRKVKRHKRGSNKAMPFKNQGGKQKRFLSKLTSPPTEQADSKVERKRGVTNVEHDRKTIVEKILFPRYMGTPNGHYY